MSDNENLQKLQKLYEEYENDLLDLFSVSAFSTLGGFQTISIGARDHVFWRGISNEIDQQELAVLDVNSFEYFVWRALCMYAEAIINSFFIVEAEELIRELGGDQSDEVVSLVEELAKGYVVSVLEVLAKDN